MCCPSVDISAAFDVSFSAPYRVYRKCLDAVSDALDVVSYVPEAPSHPELRPKDNVPQDNTFVGLSTSIATSVKHTYRLV